MQGRNLDWEWSRICTPYYLKSYFYLPRFYRSSLIQSLKDYYTLSSLPNPKIQMGQDLNGHVNKLIRVTFSYYSSFAIDLRTFFSLRFIFSGYIQVAIPANKTAGSHGLKNIWVQMFIDDNESRGLFLYIPITAIYSIRFLSRNFYETITGLVSLTFWQ